MFAEFGRQLGTCQAFLGVIVISVDPQEIALNPNPPPPFSQIAPLALPRPTLSPNICRPINQPTKQASKQATNQASKQATNQPTKPTKPTKPAKPTKPTNKACQGKGKNTQTHHPQKQCAHKKTEFPCNNLWLAPVSCLRRTFPGTWGGTMMQHTSSNSGLLEPTDGTKGSRGINRFCSFPKRSPRLHF